MSDMQTRVWDTITPGPTPASVVVTLWEVSLWNNRVQAEEYDAEAVIWRGGCRCMFGSIVQPSLSKWPYPLI